MARLAFLVVAILLAPGARAQTQPAPAVNAWYTAGHVLLGVTEPAIGLSAAWQFDQTANGDVRVVKEEQRLGTKVNGTVLSICNDRALLMKNLTPARGREMSELDGPILMLQLALRLLERGIPQGTLAVSGETLIDASEAAHPIRLRKGASARSEFLAPWRVQGRVTRIAPDRLKFDLTFGYSTPAAPWRRSEMSLVGLWQKEPRVPVFGQEMAIADWQIYRVDPIARHVAGVAVIEVGVVPYRSRFQTLGRLRTLIERNWDAGPRGSKQSDCKL